MSWTLSFSLEVVFVIDRCGRKGFVALDPHVQWFLSDFQGVPLPQWWAKRPLCPQRRRARARIRPYSLVRYATNTPLLPRAILSAPFFRQSPGPSGRKKLKEMRRKSLFDTPTNETAITSSRRKSSVRRSKFGISPKPDRAKEMAADDAQQEEEM